MASQAPVMSKQNGAGKRKCVSCMIPQKLEIIMRLDSRKSHREVMASKYNGQSITYYIKKCKDQL
jgi:hypothetical protein